MASEFVEVRIGLDGLKPMLRNGLAAKGMCEARRFRGCLTRVAAKRVVNCGEMPEKWNRELRKTAGGRVRIQRVLGTVCLIGGTWSSLCTASNHTIADVNCGTRFDVVEWAGNDCFTYLKKGGCPYHGLWDTNKTSKSRKSTPQLVLAKLPNYTSNSQEWVWNEPRCVERIRAFYTFTSYLTVWSEMNSKGSNEHRKISSRIEQMFDYTTAPLAIYVWHGIYKS